MLERISYLVILVLLLAGCRQGVNDSAGLVELDSLIAAAPDSAAARLADWPADSLRTAGDRAYHALLLTQARYKAYIPLDSGSLDTINLAVAHYADGHDPDKLMRSLLYKGCVMEELARLDSAMYYYKAAEDHAARSGDTYHRGYALMRMAWLYHSQYDFKRAIALNKQSLEAFESCNAKRQVLQVLYTTASLYTTLNTDSALLLANRAMDISSSLGYDRDYCCRTLADIYFLKEEYSHAIEMAKKSIASTADRDVYFHCHQLIARSFAILGHPDSSEYYLHECIPPQNSKDTLVLMATLSAIAVANSDPDASRLQMSTMNLADTIVNKASVKCLDKALFDYEYAVLASRHSSKTSKVIWMLLSMIFAVMALLVATVYIRRKKSRVDLKNQQLSSELAQKDKEITAHESHIRHLSDAIVERNQAISSLVNDQSLLIDRRDELLRQSAQLSQELQSLRIELASFKENEREDKKSIELLREQINAQRIHVLSIVSEMTQGADIFFRTLMEQSMSKEMASQKFRQYVNANFMTKLRSLLDVAYPALSQRMSGADCNSDDQEIVYLHFAGFTNEMICCYLNLTNKKTISNKKKSIAAKILGDDASISQLAE